MRALALWLANELQARAVVFVGTTCPNAGHAVMRDVGVETRALPL